MAYRWSVVSQAIREAFRIMDEVLTDLSLVRGPDQVIAGAAGAVGARGVR